MQEVKAFNEKRAEIYWWLSSLFSKELSDKEIEQYHSPEIRAFLTGLSENAGLKAAVTHLVGALNRLLDRDDARLELAADFCDLFLKSDKDSALPYASVYLGKTGLLNDTPAQEMADLMKQHGVAIHDSLNEPSDHLAVELDFLGHMIIRSNELEKQSHMEQAFSEQAEFIQSHLLSWVPTFATRCQSLDQFGFYAAVSELLVAFLKLDQAYLTDE
ncbi:molecular chaperone TorD [Vibrio fluvialis]|uniref:molecular chaperone TorD n=1 Tax=Vibrio fluvialis TaxID=676 RepID=UPI0012AD712D|nr:molecular chaperone TorD [Vibrio fluvialis]EKO3389561.1 molecular chaperone TorD [Vibrio fluvialis]EKO3987050.1 molecular chaperone TorD [Vibrio fluvialis]MBY8059548.1 molecular chaperone TorD [Vibrio fluvialis]MBY8141259.1 molecular chaperone TorD [Vibrio fluvialis]